MIDDSLRVLFDNEPALVGTNATFSCLPGQVLSGSYRSTCMKNGEWEPDPMEVQCIGKHVVGLGIMEYVCLGKPVMFLYSKLWPTSPSSNWFYLPLWQHN